MEDAQWQLDNFEKKTQLNEFEKTTHAETNLTV